MLIKPFEVNARIDKVYRKLLKSTLQNRCCFALVRVCRVCSPSQIAPRRCRLQRGFSVRALHVLLIGAPVAIYGRLFGWWNLDRSRCVRINSLSNTPRKSRPSQLRTICCMLLDRHSWRSFDPAVGVLRVGFQPLALVQIESNPLAIESCSFGLRRQSEAATAICLRRPVNLTMPDPRCLRSVAKLVSQHRAPTSH